jgi:hypothetical protein
LVFEKKEKREVEVEVGGLVESVIELEEMGCGRWSIVGWLVGLFVCLFEGKGGF